MSAHHQFRPLLIAFVWIHSGIGSLLGWAQDPQSVTPNALKQLKAQLAEAKHVQERLLYALRLRRASRFLTQGFATQANVLLDQCSIQHRHWEWHYLRLEDAEKNRTFQKLGKATSLLTLKGYREPVAFSSDGKRIAATNSEGKIGITDLKTGKELCTLEKPTHRVTCLAFNPQGNRIVGGKSLPFDAPRNSGLLQVWNVEDGKTIQTIYAEPKSVQRVAFSPDGKRILSVSVYYHMIQVWNTETGKNQFTSEFKLGSDSFAVFSDDGKQLIIGGKFNQIHFLDANTGTKLRKFLTEWSQSHHLAVSPNGRMAASIRYDKLQIWNLKLGKKLLEVQSNKLIGGKIFFDPTSQYIAVNQSGREVVIWDLEGRILVTLKEPARTYFKTTATFGPASLLAITGDVYAFARKKSHTQLQVWKLHIGHQGSIRSITPNSSSTRLVSAGEDHSAKIWNMKAQQEEKTLSGHEGVIHDVDISPDDQLVATASADSTIKIWSLQSGQLQQTLQGHNESVECVQFSPNGELLASSSADKSIKLWNIKTGKVVQSLEGHTATVHNLDFDSTGTKLISASDDKTIRLWDVTNGKLIRSLTGHTASIRSVAFDPNGQIVVSGGADKTIKLWDANTGKVLNSLQGHSASVNQVSFSPGGQRILSASGDGTIKLWDRISDQQVLTLQGHKGAVNSAVFGKDGRFIFSGGADREVRLWDSGSIRTK